MFDLPPTLRPLCEYYSSLVNYCHSSLAGHVKSIYLMREFSLSLSHSSTPFLCWLSVIQSLKLVDPLNYSRKGRKKGRKCFMLGIKCELRNSTLEMPLLPLELGKSFNFSENKFPTLEQPPRWHSSTRTAVAAA